MEKPRYLRSLFAAVLHDPLTAVAVASTAVTAAGSIQKGNADAANYKSQAQADEYNATVARQNATADNAVGTQQELETRTNNAMKLGEERAAVGQAGIGGPQGGTISNVIEQDSVNAELSALGVRYQRDTKAASDLDSANMDTFNASIADRNAHTAKVSGVIGAIGSVLGGANKYYSQQQQLANASPPQGTNVANNSYGPYLPSAYNSNNIPRSGGF